MNASWLEGIAPKAVVLGTGAWIAGNYLALTPEITARKLRGDGHLAQCKVGFSEQIKRQAEAVIGSVPRPRLDPVKEDAAARARKMISSPLGQELLNGPLGRMMAIDPSSAIASYEQQKAQAQAVYERTINQINAATAVKLGRADDYCSCVGEQVIESSRWELTIYTSTFGLIRPAKVKDLSVAMAQVQARNLCAGFGGVVSD